MWKVPQNKFLNKKIKLIIQEISLKIDGDQFKSLECSQRVEVVYQLIKKSKHFTTLMADSQEKKLNKKSENLRREGNNYFIGSKDYLNALEKYTESIAFAEDKQYLAFGYGNRSALLFERKYYKECLEDIDRALSLEYPENLKEKLLNRKMKAENLILGSKPVKNYNEPPVIEHKNPLIPCASDSVEIQYNAKYGRHIIATKDIKIGEVISVEKSFCHVICPQSKFLHCHECLEICFNIIPCENCTDALYCSEECKIQSYETYHKYECKFPKILLCPGLVFVKVAIKGMEDSKKLENNEPSEEIHRSDSFKEILKLTIHEEKSSYWTIFNAIIFTCIAYHALKENEEFTRKFDSDEDEQNLKIILYKAFMINSYNIFSMTKCRYTPLDLKKKNYGCALYAFSSLYNHSCVPNSHYFNHGSQLVTRAKANIKKGEQVTVCYGDYFFTTPKEERQVTLKQQYLFDCDCRACRLNWDKTDYLPLGPKFPMVFFIIRDALLASSDRSNPEHLEGLLIETKKLYCKMEKYEPCQALLTLQDLMVEIYSYQANQDVEF